MAPQIANPDLKRVPMAKGGYGRWLRAFLENRAVSGPVRTFPQAERPLLRAQDIRSLLAVPVFWEGRLWGFWGWTRVLLLAWPGGAFPPRPSWRGSRSARIFAVADVYDALTSDRPYRKAWPKEKALAYIREEAGKQFDPEVVEAFLKLMAEEA